MSLERVDEIRVKAAPSGLPKSLLEIYTFRRRGLIRERQQTAGAKARLNSDAWRYG
jgi:hypothetical protein